MMGCAAQDSLDEQVLDGVGPRSTAQYRSTT
jgi:hypothetical protein